MQLHKGLDYKLYQIYIWGGLPLIVVYIVVAVLVFDTPGVPGSKGFLVTIGPMIFWFAGILLYWWWVFLFKGNKELEELAQTQDEGIPSISSLKSWNTLHQAMAISGGNVEEFIRNAKKANRPLIVWFGTVNLLPIWIFGFIILGSLDIIPAAYFEFMLYGVFFWIAVMIFGTPFLLGWGSKSAEKAYLAPLGLAITRVPGLKPDVIGLFGGGQKLIPDGPAIVEGERYGRLVHIETIDKHCLTVLQANLSEFKVNSEAGKLVSEKGAPELVGAALKSLRKAKRWKGIQVFAGPQGIAIQRYSKGTNMWLYDLWLAEYLLDNIGGG
jgi:uncharacterized SAM-binding protein YcdF (DUF218 family)